MRRLYVATLLVSAAAIGYELLLIRVLSIVQWHHYAYMIISLALLGYGASGTAIALFRQWLLPRFESAFAAAALAFSIAMPFCFAVGQRIPFNAPEIVWDPAQFIWLVLMYLVYSVPFFLAALCIGLALTCRRERAARIYLADLAGAGAGAALLVGLLFVLDPPDALIVLVTASLAAALLIATLARPRRPFAALGLGWLALLATGIPQDRLELRVSPYKALPQALQVVDARALTTRSGPLGHVTVVESPTVGFRHAPGLAFNTRHLPPEQLAAFVDADELQVITRIEDGVSELGYLADLTQALPFVLVEAPRVLVAGAGTGHDVLLALHNGAAAVDAIEPDANLVGLVRDAYADYSGRLYDLPQVRLHVADPRGFVTRTAERWDVAHIGLSGGGAGGRALGENYLFTVESMTAFLARLGAEGMLSVTRAVEVPPREGLKLAATVIEALRASGVPEPGDHLLVIRSWNTVTLVAARRPWSPGMIEAARAFAARRAFDMVWYPGMPAAEANRYNRLDAPWFHDGVRALLGDEADRYLERYKFDLRPPTDDRPYFSRFFRWRTLPEILGLRERGGASLIQWGYLVLVATLAQAVLAGSLLVLAPLAGIRRRWPPGTASRMGPYFFLLGLAFLFVEMAFIQKFTLFLGHPLYAVAVVLAGFLVFAGLGSGYAGRVRPDRAPAAAARAIGAVAAIGVAYGLSLPAVFELFLGYSDGVRIAVSTVLLAPLGFAMGMPFPLGLARLAVSAPAFIPWAWGLNGFASVLSASLATLLAVHAGFTVVIAVALGCYAAAALVFVRGAVPLPSADPV